MSDDSMTSDGGPPIAPGRSCGKCSLCCHMLAVTELEKPAHTWCKYCEPGRAGGGCTIYQTRPPICRNYACGWLMSDKVSEEWYPLHSHMILSLSPVNGVLTCTCTVDRRFPEMWQKYPYYQQLKQMASNGLRVKTPEELLLVQVRCNGRVWLLLDDDDVEVTGLFYIAKFCGSGSPSSVELYATEEAASARVEDVIRQHHT